MASFTNLLLPSLRIDWVLEDHTRLTITMAHPSIRAARRFVVVAVARQQEHIMTSHKLVAASRKPEAITPLAVDNAQAPRTFVVQFGKLVPTNCRLEILVASPTSQAIAARSAFAEAPSFMVQRVSSKAAVALPFVADIACFHALELGPEFCQVGPGMAEPSAA